MTPRQKQALARPITKLGQPPTLHHHRMIAPFQSILTFNLHNDGDELPDDVRLMARDGRVGIWHARITLFPHGREVDTWAADQRKRADNELSRLLAGVGQGETMGKAEGAILHSFRWGTMSEVAQALRATEGKKTDGD